MNRRPWCFELRLLILQEIDNDVQPSSMALNSSPFWVRLYNLPFSCRSKEKVATIARGIGEIIEIEEDFLGLSPLQRCRVWVDCTKPLKWYQTIRVKGDAVVKITFKYERLPHFCFLCGLMNHTEKDCPYVNEEEKEKGNGWGMNIRASPRKGYNKLDEEMNVLKMKKSLYCTKPNNIGGSI